jgi:hypothetical protein
MLVIPLPQQRNSTITTSSSTWAPSAGREAT